MEQLRPELLEIIVFPAAWANAGRPGWLEEVGRISSLSNKSRSLVRCAELAKTACGGLPLQVNPVVGNDNLAEGLVSSGRDESVWRQVAGRLVSGDPGC